MENNSIPKRIEIGTPQPMYDQTQRNLGYISGDADGVLTRLFRNMCYDLTNNQYFTVSAWNRMLNKYLDDVEKTNPDINRQNERGNFHKALNAPRMTWKTFFKALKFLGIVKFRIIIEAQREDGSLSVHSTSVSFNTTQRDVETNLDIIKQAAQEALRENQSQVKKDHQSEHD